MAARTHQPALTAVSFLRGCMFAALVLLTACEEPPPRTLKPIPPAARADVYVSQGTRLGRQMLAEHGDDKVPRREASAARGYSSMLLVRSIADAQAVEALRRFANDRREGWTTPIGGAPVPSAELKFHDAQGNVVGVFGSGPNFFSGGGAHMLSRTASDAEMETYLAMIGVGHDELR